LLDTGASVTVINKKMILLDNIKPVNDIYLETDNNSKFNILGSTIIKIQIASLIIHHKAVVVDSLRTPILLGLDFMVKIQTIMNLKDNIILFRYKNREIILSIKNQKIKNDIQETQIQHVSH